MSKNTTKPAGGSAPAGQDSTMPKSDPAPSVPADLVPAIKLDFPARHKMLLEAQHAGADRKTVEDMAERLSAATLSRSQLDEIKLEIDLLVEAHEKDAKTYWLNPGQQFMLHSVVYRERDEIRLTPDEAKALASAVSETKPPLPQAIQHERKAGKYRVKSVGSVKYGGKTYRPGDILELDQEQARSVGDVIESI